MKNYHCTTLLNTKADKIYNALINGIPLWWTEMFEGSSNHKGDIFTIRFGSNVYKTMRVENLSYDTIVHWHVTDSLIAIPELKNQTEWIGTDIIWEITENEDGTSLHLTHIGLNPDVECYNICTSGWQQFVESLKSYVEAGKGSPYKAI